MTEMLEGIANPQAKREKKKKKKPIKIRIALFFDGTLNNRTNIEEREKDSNIYEEMHGSSSANSYDNGRTNIAIMYPQIESHADKYDYFFKAYIEGQGTINFQKDKTLGYAAGGGKSGVVDRAKKGIELAIESIRGEDSIDKRKYYIEKMTLDVFGFSRGAATARYAIYLILKGYTGDESDAMFQYLNLAGYEISQNAVEICFAGLYDTVLSYYGSQYFPWSSNTLQQKAVANAKKVLHLAAADEHRKDFPLHNISSAVQKGVGEEYYLPGVHADVGGSYNMANEIELEEQTDKSKKVYMLTSDEDIVLNKDEPRWVKSDREYLIHQGWYDKSELDIEVIMLDNNFNPYEDMLIGKREGIHSSYCNIPLKIMAEYARKPDVNIKIDSKLERRADIILKPENDLKKLEKIIKEYISSTKKSKAEDWIGEYSSLNDGDLRLIRHKHFHFSAKEKLGYYPRFVWNKRLKTYRRKRYIYDA